MIDNDAMQNLVHAFETLEGIEQTIDRRRRSRGSYAAALRSMGDELDRLASVLKSGGHTPDTLELLICAFHPDSRGPR